MVLTMGSTIIAGFSGRTHDDYVEEFKQPDTQRLKLAADRLRRLHGERAVAVLNERGHQAAILAREVKKRRRHMPFRRLLREAPDVLLAVFPCWMASPLSVSQLVSADREYFDVVIFDEASQILPEDAVPALLRASQAIVAGDEHQLPPTTFFADGRDEEETEDEVVSGFESLLDLMAQFVQPSPLLWHYRSRDEALIAFSNKHIYSSSLITFPGPGGEPAIRHVLVEQPDDTDGQEESSSAEVRRVVELVLEHAQNRPQETLGVIAMGLRHAQRIQAALDDALRDHADLNGFFDETRPERFFIKNLERVQGDERDAIILSIGHGKDRSGRLLYRFGPLLMEGGERRLNVAITRARRRMTAVSSFTHQEMDDTKLRREGMRLLKLYLAYAASGGRHFGDRGPSEVPINPFEADIRDALQARGIPLVAQYGVSNYRIDFVAQHPKRPGEYVLAIECDGATYHSSPTARDRDRLRQQHLESPRLAFPSNLVDRLVHAA